LHVTALDHRLTRLRQHLTDQHLNTALITRPEHVRYFAGTSTGGLPAALLVTPDAAALIAADGSAEVDALKRLGIELCAYRGYEASRLVERSARMLETLGSVARRLRVRGSVGIEGIHTALAALQAIPEAASHDLGPTLGMWRTVKDGAEQDLIRRRVALLDRAFTAARIAIRPGVSEHAVLAAVYAALLERVAEPLLLRGNLASGLRTATDNPTATGRRLERGDLVLLDLYPVLDGYAADCTRTFVVGPPSPLQRERHAALESALAAAESRLRPGAAVADVDEAVRAALRAAGRYDATMRHHVGHGLGLQAWEEPWIGPGSSGVLAEGMVIALEPGLYVPEWGGMRLEGNYLVTATGFERLDRFPSALIAAD
jgi:Xaa-Pro aminopeptidase